MFKQIEIESWQDLIATVLFAFFILVFLLVCVRVLLAKQKRIDKMANLPFEDESGSQSVEEKKRND